MTGVIYIPYANGNCRTGFNYDKEITAKQYVQMETKEYEDHKEAVDNMMTTRFGENMAINMYRKRKFNYKQQSYDYHKCKCFVLNENGRRYTEEELREFEKAGESFVAIINLNEKQLRDEPDLETDLKQWFNDSGKVKSCDVLSDEEVMYHLPKKDFMVSCEGNVEFYLKDCKFLEFMSTRYINSFAIIVSKINFVK